MSLFSSFIIDPVVRHARRFSGATAPRAEGESGGRPLSHVSRRATDTTPSLSASLGRSADGSPVVLDEVGLEQAPVIRPGRSAGEDEDEGQDNHDGTLHEAPLSLSRRATPPTAPINIPAADVGMSSNPSHTLASQLRQLHLDSPLSSSPATTNLHSPASLDLAAGDQNAPTMPMSESLPADDGMRHLRARVHQIRDLGIPDEDKARMMHGLMTERYNFLRPTSPSSFISHDRPFTPTSAQSVFSDVHISSPVSAASEVDSDNPFNLRPGDTNPTYRSRPANHSAETAGEEDDFDAFEDEAPLGCQHYKRNVKVQCYQCRRWHTCRHCHDAVEDHNLNRVKTQNMLCMVCGTPQRAAEYCTHCGTQAACYYCDICKLWDNNSNKKIYHCIDCGICRRGEGLGKDYVHCKVSYSQANPFLLADFESELQCVHFHCTRHIA